MKRAARQLVKLFRKLKRWPVTLALLLVLMSLAAWSINKTKFLAGYRGIRNDEIAVITIEEGDRVTNTPETIAVVAPNKSIWNALELLGVPLALAVLGFWFQNRQQAQSERLSKQQREQSERLSREQREQDIDAASEEVLQLYIDRISR